MLSGRTRRISGGSAVRCIRWFAGVSYAKDDAKRRIANMSGEWIPVGKKVPPDSESVLLYLDHRDGYGSAAVGYYIGGEFWLYEGDNIPCREANVDATHWMGLPAPPTDAK
jgi:hypothetical protein